MIRTKSSKKTGIFVVRKNSREAGINYSIPYLNWNT